MLDGKRPGIEFEKSGLDILRAFGRNFSGHAEIEQSSSTSETCVNRMQNISAQCLFFSLIEFAKAYSEEVLHEWKLVFLILCTLLGATVMILQNVKHK
ncbi:hypothetical protein CEXT_313871 [Caerostris extrusa]|uniref:Uncharacterized protein n=1 Tax=Caerostris extrusa TaxID=172846 RepID=A0AAV4QHU3_CAEEX|nr:hypothetical protein CEXT_313871 [Caerostris extrusa]